MSVRLSVRHTPVLCVNGYTYPQRRGRRMQGGMKKNHDFRPACFISEMMQDIAVVTMEGKQETARSLSNGSIQRQITQKRYKIELYLQWRHFQ